MLDLHHIHDYLESLTHRKYSSQTIQGYGKNLKRFAGYLKLRTIHIRDVTEHLLADYRLYLVRDGFSKRSLHDYLHCVKLLFSFLEKQDLIFLNPAANLVIPRYPKKLRSIPSGKAVFTLLSQPNTRTWTGIRNRAILETAYSCAARLGEIGSLTVGSVNIGQKTVRLYGKGKERVVPLGKQSVYWLSRYLKAHPDKESALWRNRFTDEPLTCHGIKDMVYRYNRKAGIRPRITIQALRRACATHMLQNGAHPVAIQHLLGHADLRSLSQYLGVAILELITMHERSRPGQ